MIPDLLNPGTAMFLGIINSLKKRKKEKKTVVCAILVCRMMPIKEPLLLIGKSSPCGGSGFPLLLSEWSFIICLT